MKRVRSFVWLAIVIGIVMATSCVCLAQVDQSTDDQEELKALFGRDQPDQTTEEMGDQSAQGQPVEAQLFSARRGIKPAEIAEAALPGPSLQIVGSGSWISGYSGGCGGREFQDTIPANAREAVGVIVRHGAYIDSLQMGIEKTDGTIVLLPQHGGNGGRQDIFFLATGEYITEIWGKYGSFVDSIQFRTSTGRTSPRYGGTGGCANYRYNAPPGYEIAGFYGRSGAYIDAIGVVLKRH